MREITNSDDIIDSRDVIERIRELEAQQDDAEDGELDDYEEQELADLRELASDGERLADWTYGETLIRDGYFEDYARDLADDLGLIASDAQWPATCIDWAQAARELQMDYTSLDFAGETYWARG